MAHPAAQSISIGVKSSPTRNTLVGHHDLYPEGIQLGLTVGAVTWIWMMVVDMVAGQPLHIFNAMGGVVTFSIAHLLLNVVFGIALVYAAHGAVTENSIAVALVFGAIMLEIGFAFITTLLSNLVLGNLAWFEIFLGSVIGTSLTIFLLVRRHPLFEQLMFAEVEG